MRDVVRFDAAAIRPDRRDVLERLGLGSADPVSARLEDLLAQAASLFTRIAKPVAVFEQVPRREFGVIYEGAGANAPSTPLDEIYPRAHALALYAATLGAEVDDTIRASFECGDPALGYTLDVTASGAADRLSELAAERFVARLPGRTRSLRVLPYSPGYCGWDITGQRALFERLRPVEIDVVLTASCLMDPLKSVSGAFVAGRAAVHRFRPTYPFCDACTTHACRVRMAAVK